MKAGFNMLLWTGHVTEEDFPRLEMLRKAGYDGVEIPLFGGDVAHFEMVGKAIKDNGLGCTSVTVIPDEEHNPISADAGHRKGGLEHLKWAIDCSEALCSDVLCGPFISRWASLLAKRQAKMRRDVPPRCISRPPTMHQKRT